MFFHLVRKELPREWKQRIFYRQPEDPEKQPKAEEPAPKVLRPRIIEVTKDLGPKPKRRSSHPPRPAGSSKEMVRDRVRQILFELPAGERRELLLELIADTRPDSE